MLSCVQLFAIPCTVAHQAPLFIGLPKQEYQSGLLCPPLGYLPNLGIKSITLVSLTLAGGFFAPEPPGHKTTANPWLPECWIVFHGRQGQCKLVSLSKQDFSWAQNAHNLHWRKWQVLGVKRCVSSGTVCAPETQQWAKCILAPAFTQLQSPAISFLRVQGSGGSDKSWHWFRD